MIFLAAPVWLAALAWLPFMWWLHRNSSRGRSLDVSSLQLWPESTPPDPASEASERRPPDVDWLRRAFIVTMLVLALADPTLSAPPQVITVWFDDSPSMFVREKSATRLELAAAELERALAGAGVDTVVIHPLSDPSQTWSIAGLPARLAAASPVLPGEPVLPVPESLRGDTRHWLVTDAADERINDWMRHAPFSRVIQVGSVRDNVSIVGLSIRTALAGGKRQAVQILVLNAGPTPARRQLELAAGDRLLWKAEADLSPGQARHFETEIDLVPPPLGARLTPADALEQDDSMMLAGVAWGPLRVALDPGCTGALRAAVRANLSIEVVGQESDVELAVDCSNRQAAAGVATLRVTPVLRGRALRQMPLWSPAAGPARDLPLALGSLAAAASPLQLRPGDDLLFGSAAEPLVVRRATSPAVVEVALDLASRGFSAEPAYPLFVAALLELASGRPLLDGIMSVNRSGRAAQIAPRTRLEASTTVQPSGGDERKLAAWLLWPALIALIWEAVAATRLLRVARRYYRGTSA